MAKQFVKISLATKLRILFGIAVLGIIAAALIVPWYFMELMAEQNLQGPAEEVTRLRFNEWFDKHPENPEHPSDVEHYFLRDRRLDGAQGPQLIRLSTDMVPTPRLDSAGRKALQAFLNNPELVMSGLKTRDKDHHNIYRCYRAMRVDTSCLTCHGPSAPIPLQYQPNQLVGMLEVSMPDAEESSLFLWLIQGSFVVGGALATLLAIFIFAIISQRLILRPMRHLRDVADKAGEGDLSVRSTIQTGDELQKLGESFNEMLTAISNQHGKLRQANRALDLKLSELAEANVALFQANKIKTEFLANISHELRTPLNSILGFSDLLTESTDDRIARYGKNIGVSAKHLMGLITDLLDLAKIEAGKAEVRIAQVSVTDVCQTLMALMLPLAQKKQLQLESHIQENFPLVETDAGKLQQILYNLLSNAVKFTPAGGNVTLSAIRSDQNLNNNDSGSVILSVADTGPGISEAAQEHIFDKFYQANPLLTREVEGTGLGLAISKELTQLLGGQLLLNSTPGHGTEFSLILPIRYIAPEIPPASPSA